MGIPPPGPKGVQFGRLNFEAWKVNMFGFLTALSKCYGDVVGFDLGRSPCILVNGAAQVRELFFEREACLRKPEFVKDSNRGYWGDGLTTLEGTAWQTRRGMLRPSFRPRLVSRWLSTVALFTADMLEAWSPGTEADLLKQLRILTARIAVRVVLDAELEGYGSKESRSGLIPMLEAYGEDYASAPGGDPTAPLVMVRPRAPRQMDATVRLIDDRIASGEERGDVLSDLVRARHPNSKALSRDEIVGEIIQMLYAGHLTIPTALMNFWRDIVANGLVARIAAEAEHLGGTGASDSTALSRSYCLAALKESMRLHPPAPIIYREVETTFELGGFECVHDTAIWVSPQLLHNDARYFSRPHQFLPERFMEERSSRTPGLSYLPFGAGRRVCIGNNLALQQMSVTALIMAQRSSVSSILNGS
jgi:enediyne biosynthesis protein E7